MLIVFLNARFLRMNNLNAEDNKIPEFIFDYVTKLLFVKEKL